MEDAVRWIELHRRRWTRRLDELAAYVEQAREGPA
jgi:hypothetical protein